MKRRQARKHNGRFTRNTLENTLGVHANIHNGNTPEGIFCGRFNLSNIGEPRPEHCVCGEPLNEDHE